MKAIAISILLALPLLSMEHNQLSDCTIIQQKWEVLFDKAEEELLKDYITLDALDKAGAQYFQTKLKKNPTIPGTVCPQDLAEKLELKKHNLDPSSIYLVDEMKEDRGPFLYLPRLDKILIKKDVLHAKKKAIRYPETFITPFVLQKWLVKKLFLLSKMHYLCSQYPEADFTYLINLYRRKTELLSFLKIGIDNSQQHAKFISRTCIDFGSEFLNLVVKDVITKAVESMESGKVPNEIPEVWYQRVFKPVPTTTIEIFSWIGDLPR